MEQLKKCPFCGGGEAKYIEFKQPFTTMFVTCTKCGIETKRSYLNRTDAIAAWNTRKPIERVIANLMKKINYDFTEEGNGYFKGIKKAIEIVKAELN